MSVTFPSELKQAPGMTATGIPVPESAMTELGGARNAKVVVRVRTVGGEWYEYRTSIGSRGGGAIMPFSSANRKQSGLVAGDILEVEFELDTAPRVIELPDDLRAALVASGGLDAFLAQTYSQQRAHVDPMLQAKAPETRSRRIDKIAEQFRG